MKRIGLVGCGTIGGEIARTITTKHRNHARLVALCDIDRDKAQALKKELDSSCEILDLEWMLATSDLIIEAAGIEPARAIIEKALKLKKEVMVMSTGALIDFKDSVLRNKRLYYPSGAIAGLDGIKSAVQGNIEKIALTTRKPPAGLKGARFIDKQGLNVDNITSETVIFKGTLEEAIEGFPKNINVAATIAVNLPRRHRPKLRIRIITSPEFKTNSHEIEMVGEFGRMVARTENRPSPTNPKTSYLAVLSALAKLEEIIY